MHRSDSASEKVRKTIFVGIALFLLSQVNGQTLTDEEADRIVTAEVAEFKATRPVKPEFTIIKTNDQSIGDSGIVFHKVLPPVLKEPELVERLATLDPPEKLFLENFLNDRDYCSLFLGIQVYDDQISELIWRADGRAITIWSNINFCYLTPLANIETNQVVYSLFAMVTKTTTEKELAIRERYEEAGIRKVWSEIPDPTVFSGRDPEYIVIPDSTEPIPDELLEAMDALHLYYVENENDLKNAFLRNQALAAARKRYKANNPKPKEPTVVHYWKIEPEDSK